MADDSGLFRGSLASFEEHMSRITIQDLECHVLVGLFRGSLISLEQKGLKPLMQ